MKKKEEVYYLLYRIDIESGRKTAQWLDAASYNKGWNDELMHGNIFYNIKEDEDLFVLGLMDTVMCIKKAEILPFLAIESERLVQKEDILEEEQIPTSNPRVRSKRMMSLLTRLSAQNKYYQIFNVFEHNSMLYFNCMGRISYLANGLFRFHYPAQSSLSRFLYPMASAKCEGCIRSLFSRSAMVRATFSIRS